MTRDDIIRMAREAEGWKKLYEDLVKAVSNQAGLHPPPVMLADKASYELGKSHGADDERQACAEQYLDIIRMAVEAEREACAEIVECSGYKSNGISAYEHIAAAIRARGQQ